MRYGHIALNHWSSLPRGEEILSFVLQGDDGQIEVEDLLKFPGERERRGWIAKVMHALTTTHEPTTLIHDTHIEDLLFEVVNSDHTLTLDHMTFLPQHHLHSPTLTSSTIPLTYAVEAIRSETSALLAHRKRSLKALQIARGELRWVEAFTDGSYRDREGQGGAAFIRDDGAYGALRFPATNSNEPEFVAALIAISSARGGEKVSINSDSKHVVRALNNLIALAAGKPEPHPTGRGLSRLEEATLEALTEVIEQNDVRARWVRAHCGNKMNDGADRLAKAMRKRRGRPKVASAKGITREATGVSAPVSYGFTASDLAVPDWYGDCLKKGWAEGTADAREDQFDGPLWGDPKDADEWLIRKASA